MATPSTPPKSTRRLSRFTEGSPLTIQDLIEQPTTYNEHFFTALSEMDEFEKNRKRASSASVDSVVSPPNASSAGGKPPLQRRSRSETGRASSDGVREWGSRHRAWVVEENITQKLKGRLRALTGGREFHHVPKKWADSAS